MKIRSRAAILGSIVLTAALACGSGGQPSGVDVITADELAAAIAAGEAPFVLDVRSEDEFAAGHIPGAVNVPYDQLASRLAELPADRGAEVVVHCKSGRRAGVAESVLTDAGFTNLRDLEGHMQAWQKANHPVE